MRERSAVRGGRAPEAPPLHPAREALAVGCGARVDVLAFLEEIGGDDAADFWEAGFVFHSEFRDVAFQWHAVCSEMAPFRPRDVPRLFCARAHLYSPVAVDLFAPVVGDLASVELQDGAGCPLAGLGVVHARHTLFDGEGAGAEGHHGFFAQEGGCFGCAEGGQVGAMVETVVFDFGRDGLDGAEELSGDGGAEEAGREGEGAEGGFGRHCCGVDEEERDG